MDGKVHFVKAAIHIAEWVICAKHQDYLGWRPGRRRVGVGVGTVQGRAYSGSAGKKTSTPVVIEGGVSG
jgi:hypothetical protein